MKLLKVKVKGEGKVYATFWCRNGHVCDKATPCEHVICPYKETQYDIKDGVKKCGQYQITRMQDVDDWYTARHLSNDLSTIAVWCDFSYFKKSAEARAKGNLIERETNLKLYIDFQFLIEKEKLHYILSRKLTYEQLMAVGKLLGDMNEK